MYAMTTIPSRIKSAHKTIDSILDAMQGDSDFRIILSIPRAYSFRFKGEAISEDTIADLKAKYKKMNVHIHRSVSDYGPGTKLIGAVEALESGFGGESGTKWETIIILVDDDQFYTTSHLHHFLREYNKIEGACAAACSMWNAPGHLIGEAFLGLAVPYRFVKGCVLFMVVYNAIKEHPQILYHDDVWISWLVTRLSGRTIAALPPTEEHWGGCFAHSGQKDALNAVVGEFSRENVNKSSVAALDKVAASGALAFVETFSKKFEK